MGIVKLPLMSKNRKGLLFNTIANLSNLTKKLAGTARSSVYILEGTEPNTGKPLRILFAGGDQLKKYVARLVFNGTNSETSLGKLYFWNIRRLLRRNGGDCALGFIEGHRPHQLLYQKSGDYYLPSWVWSSVEIPLKPASKGAKEDLRRIRKNNLSYELSKNAEDTLDFYENIYLPTMHARHENLAVVSDFNEISRSLKERDSLLLLIKHEKTTIAGVIILMKDTPSLWLGGIRHSSDIYRRMGAVGATYFFPATYLAAQGYRQMDLGRSRCFVNDGVFRYKGKWNHHVSGFDKDGMILEILDVSDATAGFLSSQPFICVEHGELYATTFVNASSDSSEKKQREIDMLRCIHGLAAVNVYDPKVQQNKICKIGTFPTRT
jgi:hypothetical protein